MATLLGCSPDASTTTQVKQQTREAETTQIDACVSAESGLKDGVGKDGDTEIKSEDVGDYRVLREIQRGREGAVIVRLKRSHYTKEHRDNALIAAVEEGHLHMVKALAEDISDVNAKESRALILAVERKIWTWLGNF